MLINSFLLQSDIKGVIKASLHVPKPVARKSIMGFKEATSEDDMDDDDY